MKIALVGPAGAGKSEVANYLEKVYDMELWTLGGYVKLALISIGVPEVWVWAKPPPDWLKEMLRVVETGMRRVDDEHWLTMLADEIDRIDPEDVCVCDLQHMNEAEYLRDEGFKLVVVEAHGGPDTDHNYEDEFGEDFEWDGVIMFPHGEPLKMCEEVDNMMQGWENE